MKITNVGTDPEFILKKNDKYLCAIPFLGGASKSNPFPITGSQGHIIEGFAFMHDRALVEFNQPPTMDLNEFKTHLKFAQDSILKLVNSDFSKEGDIVISKDASAYFDWEELLDPAAIEIGCVPSWNAWTNKQNEIPDVSNTNLQAAGMHFHLEVDQLDYHQMICAVRAMDLFLAVPAVILDTDIHRKSLGYGTAGAFREMIDKNRFEYRVLSNFILFNEDYLDFMWGQLFKAVDFVNENEIIQGQLGEDIQKCINNSDMGLANKLIEQFKIELPVWQEQKVLV